MNEEFDAEACSEAIREEIEWQTKEWERERLKEYAGEIKKLMNDI